MENNLNSFLTLGYFLDYKNPCYSIDISNIDKDKYDAATEQELIQEGARLWYEAISHNFISASKNLVPISGGLDSRAVLACLLRHTEAKNISTYTFGTAKTLDYDIGNLIASKLGTEHTCYDLKKHIYTQAELENISRRVDFQTVLFHHPPVWQVDEKYRGYKLWSGFFGDSLTGAKLVKRPSETLQGAKEKFKIKNRYVSSINLLKKYDFDHLIDCTSYCADKLTLDEQVDFQNRQTKYIAPHVIMTGYDYKTPFLNQPLINFMLSVPNRYREDQYLYKKILFHAFPKEFAYATKANMGLPLKASKAMVLVKRVQNKMKRMSGLGVPVSTNYLDFNTEIRQKPDLRKVISENMLDLKARKIIDWIDLEQILNNHLSNKANHADALIVLSSLEIHLKAGLKL